MYFVKYGDEYIHDPRIDLTLPSAELEVVVNRSDNFSFEIPITSEICSKIKERDINNPVTIYSDDKIIFRGIVISIKQNFYLTKTVQCKGELAYLNDTILRPYSSIEGEGELLVPSTLNGFFEFLIKEHNSRVDASQRFIIGSNLAADINSNDDLYFSDTSYTTIGSCISESIIGEYGGYLSLEYLPNNQRRISIAKDFEKENSQIIEFGQNLLDFTKSIDTTDIASYIIPLGDLLYDKTDDDDPGRKLNITSSMVDIFEKNVEYDTNTLQEAIDYYNSLGPEATEEEIKEAEDAIIEARQELLITIDKKNDAKTNTIDRNLTNDLVKSGDIIYSRKAVNAYGWIGTTGDYDDMTYVGDIINYGMAQLIMSSQPTLTIEIKAVDLSLIKPDYKPIECGQYVRVVSKPHGFDSYLLCSDITYDLVKPDNNTFILGTSYGTLTGQSNKKINELNSKVNKAFDLINALSKK